MIVLQPARSRSGSHVDILAGALTRQLINRIGPPVPGMLRLPIRSVSRSLRSRFSNSLTQSIRILSRPELSAPIRVSVYIRSASSKPWVARQARDQFAREARVQGLKSRAAFKLLEIDEKHRLFKRGQTVVDLGYAPGSWSQV